MFDLTAIRMRKLNDIAVMYKLNMPLFSSGSDTEQSFRNTIISPLPLASCIYRKKNRIRMKLSIISHKFSFALH